MVRSGVVLTLGAVLLLSGCVWNGSDDKERAITVFEKSVTPSSVYAGSQVTVNLGVRNSGDIPADLTVNRKEGDKGRNILTDYCRDIFSVKDFNHRGSGEMEDGVYTLPPNGEARFTWVLENTNTENVPLIGYSCPIKTRVPFQYSVRSYRQFQFKENEEISGSPKLDAKTSQGPLDFRIRLFGSTSSQAATFLPGDNAEASIYMQKRQGDKSDYTGFISASKPEIEIRNAEFEEENCGVETGNITMYRSESERFRCDIERPEEIEGAQRAEITAETDYTYIRDLNEMTVEVKPRGN